MVTIQGTDARLAEKRWSSSVENRANESHLRGASFPQIEVYLAWVYGSLWIHLSSNCRRNRSDVVPCDSEFWNGSKRPLNSLRTRGHVERGMLAIGGRLAEKFTTTINFVHRAGSRIIKKRRKKTEKAVWRKKKKKMKRKMMKKKKGETGELQVARPLHNYPRRFVHQTFSRWYSPLMIFVIDPSAFLPNSDW